MTFNDKTIDIFGTEWSVKFVDKVTTPDEDDDRFYFGMTYNEKHLIEIATENSVGDPYDENTILKTLCHEITHAILDEGQYLNETYNEPLVEWIGGCLRSLYKQNFFNFNEGTN